MILPWAVRRLADLKHPDLAATHKTKAVQEFLAGHEGRVQFHFTPTHASWLNQIELWFSTLTRRVLHLGDFASRDRLERTVMDFIDHHNHHDARPYRWTYTGQPRAVGSRIVAV